MNDNIPYEFDETSVRRQVRQLGMLTNYMNHGNVRVSHVEMHWDKELNVISCSVDFFPEKNNKTVMENDFPYSDGE